MADLFSQSSYPSDTLYTIPSDTLSLSFLGSPQSRVPRPRISTFTPKSGPMAGHTSPQESACGSPPNHRQSRPITASGVCPNAASGLIPHCKPSLPHAHPMLTSDGAFIRNTGDMATDGSNRTRASDQWICWHRKISSTRDTAGRSLAKKFKAEGH